MERSPEDGKNHPGIYFEDRPNVEGPLTEYV